MKTSLTPSASPAASSRDLLSITGDGSPRSVVESLLKHKPKGSLANKPKTFKVARSPLLGQIQSFLPELRKSTQELLSQPQEKIQGMDIENTVDDGKVVEMDILIGEMACDSDESDEQSTHSSTLHESGSDSDSESRVTSVLGPVTIKNIKIPSEAKGGRKKMKHCIQVIADEHDEERTSHESKKLDIELTETFSSSGKK